MALSCLGSGGNEEGLQIADSLFLTLSPPWTLFVMLRPDSGISRNTFGYLYAHAAPLANVSALNVMIGAGNIIRVIIDQPGGNLVDLDTSNAAPDDLWTGLAIEYDGSSVSVVLNGITTTAFPPAIGTVNPSGSANLGFATHGPNREFPGRLCHWSKWDRSLQSDELEKYTKVLISPEFAQQDHAWHIESFNNAHHGDLQNNVTVSESSSGALYGPHANASYPADRYELTHVDQPDPGSQGFMSQWTMV